MGVRGVLLRTTAQSRHICEAIADEGFPAVVISERFDAPHVGFIDCESRNDSVQAVEYLIRLGHRRIAFAMNAVPDCDHLDRFEGYKEALERNSLPFDEGIVFKQRASLSGGATLVEMLVRVADRPTAVYFADQVLAVGGVNKAHELGLRIPDDLSIVGVDDSEMRYSVHPTMTAVCQDAAQLGFEASLGLTRMVTRASKTCFQKTLPSFFEVNESTGPPGKSAALDVDRGGPGRDDTGGNGNGGRP
jgi:DNA-binding LacI/PurR family transcriptional regulator